MKQLFLDDEKLFGRENVVRAYGAPQLVSTYFDGIFSTDYNAVYVFRMKNGQYKMIYYGTHIETGKHALLMATSCDGLHFEPEDLTQKIALENRIAEHELLKLPDGSEIASIYEDTTASPPERYKMLVCTLDGLALQIENRLYISPDLYHWTWLEDVNWGVGNEPLTGVFYNKSRSCYTIMLRPYWGIRRVGYVETKDWKTFSEFSPSLQVDSIDQPLDEIYGMPAFSYGDMYIGFPHIYKNLTSTHSAKFWGGDIVSQLAYSFDGRHWQRSLRNDFIPLLPTEHLQWLTDMKCFEDGRVNLYACTSELEHGPAFRCPGTGRIKIYQLQNDRFITLRTEDSMKESTVSTREKVWHGGELHVNIDARYATVAVLDSAETEDMGGNVLGIARPMEGFGHEDCEPFSGDSIDWVPKFKNGRTLDELTGKTIVFEIKFRDGRLFSLSGDFTNVSNTQAARYRKFHVLPENKY